MSIETFKFLKKCTNWYLDSLVAKGALPPLSGLKEVQLLLRDLKEAARLYSDTNLEKTLEDMPLSSPLVIGAILAKNFDNLIRSPWGGPLILWFPKKHAKTLKWLFEWLIKPFGPAGKATMDEVALRAIDGAVE